jgi:hypothetical protein
MKKYLRLYPCALLLSLITTVSFTVQSITPADVLTGAWSWQNGNREETASFIDGYFAHAVYNKAGKQFLYTWGGTYAVQGNQLKIKVEFNSQDKEKVGQELTIPFTLAGDGLKISLNGEAATWKQTDKGTGELAGTWRIAGRKQGEQPVTMPTGPRKTLKVLSGTRFQWIAMNTATKEFSGTGGGTYTFVDGKYTENIEFFSRDSTRVGASLSFNGKVTKDEWNHTGLSSRGQPIDEMWKRITKE